MAKNVLIATLGESPIVVTSMVHALKRKNNLTINQLHVIHPRGERLIDIGYDLIKEHLQEKCIITQSVLPFSDVNSLETSIEFLRVLSDSIQTHDEARDHVYLSLAGGRKNMSALMAVTCQFYECVRGLYHILDKYEDDPDNQNFHSIEALFDFEEDIRGEKLSPPVDSLILVEIPYKQLPSGVTLRQYFSEVQFDPDDPSFIEIDDELEGFYREILQQEKTDLLEVYLSKVAYEQFKAIGGGSTQKQLMNCFRSMQYSQLLESRGKSLRNAKTDCTPFKMGRTAERPFYYRTNGDVVVCEIALKNTTYEAVTNGKKEIWSKKHDKFLHVNELNNTENSILIVPLGKTPMVVTQTFALLSTREEANIEKVIVIHPKIAEIRNGVRLLQTAFKQKGFDRTITPIQIDDIQDVASKNDCDVYLEKLTNIIKDVQTGNPNISIHLSLSGGRKGMAALTLFAAQQANIDTVYHTLITDADLEEKIEKETTLAELRRLKRIQQAQRLFLDDYDQSKFELIRVPVVPIS